MEKATFAAGCFWGVESAFRKVNGVVDTVVGYTDGRTDAPTYKEVCGGDTGHAEAVQVEFDPSVISYEELLMVFWDLHDPTTLNRQGPDVGTQYRTSIFFHTPEQEKLAQAALKKLQSKFSSQIVTEIKPAKSFHPAEAYHQRYLEKQGE